MNGNERRRMEICHPELFPTTDEIRKRRQFCKDTISVCKSISMSFMVIGAVIVAFLSTKYSGWTGFSIAFFGIMIDIFFGAIIAYNLGERMKNLYTERFITKHVNRVY